MQSVQKNKFHLTLKTNRRNSQDSLSQKQLYETRLTMGIGMSDGGSSQRIHSTLILQKRGQIAITPHKRKRNIIQQCQLPSLGRDDQNKKNERVRIRFPPQKIKKIF